MCREERRIMYHSLSLVMAAVVTATAAVIIKKKKARLRRRMMMLSTRRYWVHPVIANREDRGQFKMIYNDLRQHKENFFNYTCMSVDR